LDVQREIFLVLDEIIDFETRMSIRGYNVMAWVKHTSDDDLIHGFLKEM
jgi:hypothetical protein